MKVILSGMNIDVERLDEYRKRARTTRNLIESRGGSSCDEAIRFLTDLEESKDLTPETLSAGYARISRDPRPVDEIRREAARDVERARRSNETIIFGMGHSSVAEHAVFNLDIIGISRLAAEYLQRTRLASYTEKSQRYIALGTDYVIPEEIKEMGLVGRFTETARSMATAYHVLLDRLKTHLLQKHQKTGADEKTKRLVEGIAKEDARYAAPLAVLSQMGMTANSRVIEMTIRRLAASPLSEVRRLSQEIYRAVYPHAPSVIRYTLPTAYDLKTPDAIARALSPEVTGGTDADTPRVTLVDYTADGDENLLAALLFSHAGRDISSCREAVRSMDNGEKRKLFDATFSHMESYDRVLREFEMITLVFEAVVSASGFAQLKRHRIMTIVPQEYDVGLGIEVPPSIVEAHAAVIITEAAQKAEALYELIKRKNRHAAPYILTNAHRRRVLISTNLRELYHVSRLRMDAEAQWDIRGLAAEMVRKAQEVLPLSGRLLGGKDAFDGLKAGPGTTEKRP
jgi:flavin-dependent thymidylate synthase